MHIQNFYLNHLTTGRPVVTELNTFLCMFVLNLHDTQLLVQPNTTLVDFTVTGTPLETTGVVFELQTTNWLCFSCMGGFHRESEGEDLMA